MSDTPDLDDSFSDAPETIERDDLTADIFGDAPAPQAVTKAPEKAPDKSGAYTVLARKYRPRTFEDLIGQEAMVRTLTNAFASNRIAHAFMLTGVRGVGKTTTARLLARALDYESDTVHQPSVDLKTMGVHCQAIIEGRHIDVLELDAASRTGVDAMRDLLESVRYAPVEARYKVYVIDEVHMLSTGAFNALLKTLEEPPPHAKFIFATTEIRKVPVTILSRCQRFDLRRVEPETLTPFLETICEKEGVRIDADAVALIARAAEGSVRDSLSLLDQALVQAEAGETVGAEIVRDMLGLADRSATLSLFENIISGQMSEALLAFRTLYGFGADPSQIMGDLLDYCHSTSVAKVLGAEATRLPKAQAMRVTALGTQLSAGTLSRLWTLMLKAFEELRRAPDASAAFEMALVRLCYSADLPGPEALMKRLQNGEPLMPGAPNAPGGGGGGPSARGAAAVQMRTAPQALPNPQSFDEVLQLITDRRDIGLRADVERFVRLVAFQPGAITFEPAPNTPGDLVRKLSLRLKEWTGNRWLIATEGSGGAESVMERDKRETSEMRARIQAHPFVSQMMDIFPGAEITAIRARPKPVVSDAPPAVPEDERPDSEKDED
ncbi:DNA polymerase III subunit gamma/tau [Asticcacaulis sp. EMRT-3]|uniref:DNA polymerase III subunit gamma/tau n=1 Tax=Asticcacaulis sp. EMRT-3 TaxID=3040349 RepID=UPI0024AE9F92|nr:DNA polymerase III subunit gamma/tau [Asticcacaulis sp. EMRT-3]MDI7776212.1 DNA polymerase III subunit gamma/tau [Asticcacaulis sp. EMRT-3]